jgi:hypothetical protein
MGKATSTLPAVINVKQPDTILQLLLEPLVLVLEYGYRCLDSIGVVGA